MFITIISITLWLVYFYFVNPSTLFFSVSFLLSIGFSYWLAEELVFQRQIDPQINFILVNPNSIVYCTFYLFISCRFIFCMLFFTFMFFPYLKAFFSNQTFKSYWFSIAFLYFLFFIAYIIIDNDISNTFLLRQPKNTILDGNTVTQTGPVYSFEVRPWEYSLYFFQFFGIFFDFFISFCFMHSLFILFWWFNCKFYILKNFKSIKGQSSFWSKKIPSNSNFFGISQMKHPLFPNHIVYKPNLLYINSFSWGIRRCIFIVSFYFYSGEMYIYDILASWSIICFIEFALFLCYLIRSLHRHKNKTIT